MIYKNVAVDMLYSGEVFKEGKSLGIVNTLDLAKKVDALHILLKPVYYSRNGIGLDNRISELVTITEETMLLFVRSELSAYAVSRIRNRKPKGDRFIVPTSSRIWQPKEGLAGFSRYLRKFDPNAIYVFSPEFVNGYEASNNNEVDEVIKMLRLFFPIPDGIAIYAGLSGGQDN